VSGDRAYSEETLTIAAPLDVPTAHGVPIGCATVRAQPEDFLVSEWLGYEANGAGDHVLLRVRKRAANTFWVAKQLARIAKVPPRDIGYAGLKDRDAVAEQAFTVPLKSARGEEWVGVTGEGFEVLAAARHRRKLKRGALRGNEFTIVLRDFQGDSTALEERLKRIEAQGVPNYFGPQRFGHGGRNLEVAIQWFESGVSPNDRLERSFAISAARSALFNAVLAGRVRADTWDRLLPGDLANLDGTGSIFSVEAVDETLAHRCEILDIHPTGPLWDGRSSASGAIQALEEDIAAQFRVLSTGLAQVGLEPERRSLRMRVANLRWSIEGPNVTLSFRLPKGAFATAVLHEIIADVFGADVHEGD
jgi:tRNA pseudouridine13 synthase